MIERVLIVGFGSIGGRHLRIARQLLPNADIRVLRHLPGASIPDYADGVFFSLDDAISFVPNVAVIANPAPFHIPVSQALASTGSHLLVEKPLSDRLEGVIKLLETCEQRGVRLFTGYNLRFNSTLQRFSELLKEGVVGRVLSVRCEVGQYLPNWRVGRDYRKTVSAQKKLGGGALLELSHELDYLRWIFGEVEWVRATLSRQSTLEIDVEDTAFLCLGFKAILDYAAPIATIHLDLVRHDTTRCCSVIGESGTLRWNGVTGYVDLYRSGNKNWEVLFHEQQQSDDSYIAEWMNLINCIENQAAPLVTGYDGVKVLEIIAAARISARTGETVYIDNVRKSEWGCT